MGNIVFVIWATNWLIWIIGDIIEYQTTGEFADSTWRVFMTHTLFFALLLEIIL